MIKKIKNATNNEIVLVGQSIFPNEYYTIQSNEESLLCSNPVLIGYITTGSIIVNDGTNDITDKTSALQYLTDDLPREIIAKPVDNYVLQANSISTTVTAGDTGTFSFKIENYPGELYAAKHVKGGRMFVKNGEYGDYIEIDIVDLDNIFGYGAGLVLKQYCIKMYIDPTTINNLECPFAPGRIPINLYVRCKYHSTGTQNVQVYLNLMVFTKDFDTIVEEESSSSSSM